MVASWLMPVSAIHTGRLVSARMSVSDWPNIIAKVTLSPPRYPSRPTALISLIAGADPPAQLPQFHGPISTNVWTWPA